MSELKDKIVEGMWWAFIAITMIVALYYAFSV